MVLGWHCCVSEEKLSAVDLWHFTGQKVGSCAERRGAVMLSPACDPCLSSWDLFTIIVLAWST